MTSLVFLVTVAIPAAQPKAHNRPVQVVFKNGRVLVGMIDAASHEKALALRMERGNVRLTMEIPWSQVRHIQFRNVTLTAAEIVKHLASYRSKAKRLSGPGPWQRTAQRPSRHRIRNGSHKSSQRIQSLDVFVTLANWDRDEEPDGFQVRVLPRGRDGHVVPVAGFVQVKLIGRRTDTAVLPNPTKELEQWSRRVSLSDFGTQAPLYRLPFRRISPDRDRTLDSLATVIVRLSVPGQGTYDASVETRIRRFRYQQGL